MRQPSPLQPSWQASMALTDRHLVLALTSRYLVAHGVRDSMIFGPRSGDGRGALSDEEASYPGPATGTPFEALLHSAVSSLLFLFLSLSLSLSFSLSFSLSLFLSLFPSLPPAPLL